MSSSFFCYFDVYFLSPLHPDTLFLPLYPDVPLFLSLFPGIVFFHPSILYHLLFPLYILMSSSLSSVILLSLFSFTPLFQCLFLCHPSIPMSSFPSPIYSGVLFSFIPLSWCPLCFYLFILVSSSLSPTNMVSFSFPIPPSWCPSVLMFSSLSSYYSDVVFFHPFILLSFFSFTPIPVFSSFSSPYPDIDFSFTSL